MRAADVEKDLRTAPPHVFTLGPTAWPSLWDARPTEPIQLGMRLVSAHERGLANQEALARADRTVPQQRRHQGDPEWLKAFSIAFMHYILGYALCHPQDVRRNLWPDQDGQLTLVDAQDQDGKPGRVTLVSRRFTDAALTRCYDELELTERANGVPKRSALDGETQRLGEILADGSLLKALREVGTDETRAVEAHLRVLFGQALELIEHGRESPHPAAM